MLKFSLNFSDWIRKYSQKLKPVLKRIPNHPKYLIVAVLTSFFLLTALIYALPVSESSNAVNGEDNDSPGIIKTFFMPRNTDEDDISFKITDPTHLSSNPEKALSNQFKHANKNKFHNLTPGNKLDFSYEITNTGSQALDVRETYYILTFIPQSASNLDFAMFGSVSLSTVYPGAYVGESALSAHKLDRVGRLYSFTSEPYTLSGSDEIIDGAPSSKRSERYMVYSCFAGNLTQGERVAVITTLGFKNHSDDDWEPSITDTVLLGGLTNPMEYRTDTDVYLSCDIAALDDINPDNRGYVQFTVTDPIGTKHTLIYDDFSSPVIGVQRAYIPFHIPNIPGKLTVTITSSDNVVCDTEKIVATVVRSDENTPPDPTLDMAISTPGPLPTFSESENHEWVTYSASKNADGVWEYEEHTYTASLDTMFTLTPDSNAKTAAGNTLSSGYGINAEIESDLSANSPDTFNIQNVYCFFPEFDYEDYSRKLEISSQDALNTTWVFRKNQYSHSDSRAHYIPPAYPDGLYTVFAEVRDAWTPVGELKGSVTAEVNIIGSLYDDWYITPSD